MEKLACLFRAAQLYAHASHNQVRGATFFSDHEFLGGLYGNYEEAYDKTVEQMIGLAMAPNLANIQRCACDLSTALPDPAVFSCEIVFATLLKLETDIQTEISNLYESSDIGTQNILAQFFEDSQHRGNYKIGQRLKK